MKDPAVPALAALSGILLLTGIIVASIASSIGRSIAKDQETHLIATRSRYILGQVAGSTLCEEGADGCDGEGRDPCDPIDLTSSVPTWAYFHFYNITNAEAVDAGSPAVLAEVGPYTCLTAPPVMTARITRTSSTASSDHTAETMEFEQVLECDSVTNGDAIIYLYDKSTGEVEMKSATEWVATLKTTVLSSGDTVGTGGAPDFESYTAHGNTSVPNNYMRRTSDDAPILPIFPHGYVADGEHTLKAMITPEYIIQWHIASIGQTVSFTWQYPLYLAEPVLDRWMYARFVGYLVEEDLTSRNSNHFDKGYSYHGCSATVSLEADITYPGCTAKEENEVLSVDDFYLDVNLILGIPAPFRDFSAAGGWQAWQIPAFADIAAASPNCTGSYQDAGIAYVDTGSFPGMGIFAWGFWTGTMPYVCHSEAGYDPFSHGHPSKWLAEFGVTRTSGEILPAFAFSIMPKMIPMISPAKLGETFPTIVMGKVSDSMQIINDRFGITLNGAPTTYMQAWGMGALYYFTFHAQGYYSLYLALGVYTVVFSFVPLITSAFRFKMAQSS